MALMGLAGLVCASSLAEQSIPPSFQQLVQLDSRQMATQASSPQNIDGKIKINGQVYDVVCDCSKSWKQRVAEEMNSTTPDCAKPSKFKIKRVDWSPTRVEGQITAHDVREFLGLPSQLQYVNARERYFTELDSRPSAATLGSVGGDAGDFILALQVYAHETQREFSDEDVLRYFQQFLNATAPRKFYLHTSASALERLQESVGVEQLNLANPRTDPPSLREEVLGTCPPNKEPPCGLMDPLNVGDVNIKLMMLNEDRYLISNKLVQSALKAFYTVLWNKESELSDRIRFEVVSSIIQHPERGLINVMVSEGCKHERQVPLIPTRNGETALFVNHVDAVDARRGDMASFFSRISGSHSVSANSMYRLMDRFGQRMYSNTVAKLAGGLPIFDVYIL
eukprot:CAMPEP_0196778586 /NCGR_PEP_ID=MMETSP1104-20130614/5886_1 /TAXON_ID=33652 /ORGANISM="Cafeteria sp., Strain Caron Lab Isolate" /LENGTH=394 /DNA_ID=CAMNT_0042148759 /DNA_START=50 /DNA_END=1234 /DNA_ORIENTATION=+